MRACVKKFNYQDEFYIDEGCYITEISNSDDDPNISIARARVEPGVTTMLHRLLDTIERYVVLEGEGLIEVEGVAPQKLGPCDVVIIPSERAQKITNTSSNDLVFLAICTPRFKQESYRSIEK